MPVRIGVDAETGPFQTVFDRKALNVLRRQGPGGNINAAVAANKATQQNGDYGVVSEVSIANLSEAGWAVLFGPTVSDDIKRELQPLLDHRREKEYGVGNDERFKVFNDYQPGMSADDWLDAHDHLTMQVVDPGMGVPFYILIVASPQEIPFDFQYELDVCWGVGRLWFDRVEDFGCYARSVIAYEKGAVTTSRELALFGTHQEADPPSIALYNNIFDPWIKTSFGRDWRFTLKDLTSSLGTKDRFAALLRGDAEGGTPALLFTGTHGLEWTRLGRWDQPDGLPRKTQGALICQDWSGTTAPNLEQQVFAASDIPMNAKIHGMIVFLFACFGGGWPEFSSYFQDSNGTPERIAPGVDISQLPQALLGRENGALAVFGHVDRVWSYSYTRDIRTYAPQTQGLRDILGCLMKGDRLGSATEQLSVRWMATKIQLDKGRDSLQRGDGKFTPAQVADLWTIHNDARNYILYGDPAVRIRQTEMQPVAVNSTAT